MDSSSDSLSHLLEENRRLLFRLEQLQTTLDRIVGVSGMSRDIDSSYITLLDSLPVGVFIYQDDVIRFANRTAFEFSGLDPIQDDPNEILSLVPLEYRRTISQVAAARRRGLPVNDPYLVKVMLPTSDARWVLIRGQLIQYEGSQATLGVAVDFTSHKHAGDVIEASQANLEAILENTDDYILLSDRRGNPVYFNTAYARIIKEILGVDMKPGIKPHTFLPDKAAREIWEEYHRRVLSGERFTSEYSVTDSSGKERHLQVAYYPVMDHGKVTGFCEYTHEITKFRLAQQKLDRARQEQTEQLRRVAGGIAHEVHNSLFPLSASVYMLKQFLKNLDHEKAAHFLGLVSNMEKSLERSIDLTDSVMKLSRLEDIGKVSTELGAALNEVLDRHRDRLDLAKVEVDTDIPEHLTVNCPAIYLSEVLENLVVNAVDAVKNAPVRKLSAKAGENPDFVLLDLTDSGSGISPEDQAKVFDPFFSTKSGEGSGIGLAIVKRVIDLCGGEISVMSQPGVGTTMTVRLPRGGTR